MLKTITLLLGLAMVVAIGLPLPASTAGNLCCPSCGCHEGMCPVCHVYNTCKTVTEFEYRCVCEDICVPNPTCCCKGCNACGGGNSCDSCQQGCKCLVRTVHKLVKVPVTKQVPVRKCTVEWVCPKCHCNCSCEEGAPPSGTMPSPTPAPVPAVGKTAAVGGGPDSSAPLPPSPLVTGESAAH
jgi:hypothetical protein